MQKTLKKALSLVLALVMVLGIIPFTTFAAQGATEQTEKNSDMLASASYASSSWNWNGSGKLSYASNSTVTNGTDSLRSWRFSTKEQTEYSYARMQINLNQVYDLTNKDLVFDVKVDPAQDLTSYNIGVLLYDSKWQALGHTENYREHNVYFTGDGWHTVRVDNASLRAYLPEGKDLSAVQLVYLSFTFPNGPAQNFYIDNMHLEDSSFGTDATDSAADLLANATVASSNANGSSLIYNHANTKVAFGGDSNKSHEFAAAVNESGTLTVKYDLGKSYDLTNKNFVLDIFSRKAGSTVDFVLYNSKNQQVSSATAFATQNVWAEIRPAILAGLKSGMNLTDVRYISIGTRFNDSTTREGRAFFIDNLRIEDIEVHHTPLQSKNVVFMGDSITAAGGFKGWSGELQEHYLINRYNIGVGGASYATIQNRTTIYQQTSRIPNVDVDFFVLNGGVNDVWSAWDLGSVSNVSVDNATVNSFDTNTTAGAMEQMFCYLRTNHPDAKILFVINYLCYASDFNGVKFRDEFVPLAKALCEKWDIPYVDLCNDAEFNAQFSALYGVHTYDGVHGNDIGYELAMKQIAPQLIAMCDATEQSEQSSDRLAYATYAWSASDWSGAGSLSYANNCTETNGSESVRSWKFSATAQQTENAGVQLYLPSYARMNLAGKSISFDVKFEASNGKATQKIAITPYDKNWQAITSSALWLNGDGSSGWQTMTVEASALEAILANGKSLNDVALVYFTFNFADNKGNAQTVYVDNLRLNTKTATDATEAASDLLYGASYVDGYFTTAGFGFDQKNTTFVSGTDSKYSLRFFAADNKTAWTTATFKLPKSINLTNSSLKFDVLGYNQKMLYLDLYDSELKLVTSDQFYLQDNGWQTFEINSLFGLASGKTAEDLKEISYIRFSFSFEKAETGRTIIIDNLNTYANEQYETNISGMTGLYLGDSISEAISYKGWAGEMAEHYGVNGVNVSASGAVVINNQTHNIHQQLDKAPKDVEFDFVLLNGGVNDVWRSLPLGSVSPEGTTTFDVNTTIGALEDLFSKLKATYPNSQIVFILNYVCVQNGYPSDTFRDVYAPLAREACAKWDIHCLDLVDNDAFNAEFDATANVHTYDGVHPNKPGYDVLTAYIVDYLEDVMLDESQDPYWTLEKNEAVDLNLTEDLYVNLNGYTLSGTINTNGFNVYAIDSTTDKYTCDKMGYFTAKDSSGNAVIPVAHFRSYANGTVKRYVTIETESGYTFHRFYVGITKQSLAPNVTGVGYKAVFCGDEMVRAIMDENKAYGYELKLEGYAPISRSRDRDSFVSGKEVSLRINNFDVENHGETNLYASVWVNLNGEKICSSEYTLTLRQMVEMVNAEYESYSETQLQAVRDMITANPIMENWNVENLLKQVATRGNYFEAGENFVLDVEGTEEMSTLSFDYRIVEGEQVNIALMMPDWANYYGYYALVAGGTRDVYEGVTTTTLDDGYVHVSFDLNKINKIEGSPTKNIDFLFIRGDWSDAAGYIDNVQFTTGTTEPEQPGQVFEGGQFTAGSDLTLALDNDQAITKVTFDYTIESGEYFHVAVMPDWYNYFGYFKFDANGTGWEYPGVTTEKLSGGVIRVTIDLTAVTAINGNPSNVLQLFYVRGNWTEANGTISNICLSSGAVESYRGEAIEAGVNKTILTNTKESLKEISFDYKILNGERFNIFLGTDWSNYFGLYKFVAGGAAQSYPGVTTQVLEDGYIRVTFDMAALTTKVGSPTASIEFLFIRGDWTDANGYIDNLQLKVGATEPEQPDEPDVPMGAETVSGDWTNMRVDQGMSTATYSMSNQHTASGSERALKITTKSGDVGTVYLNSYDAFDKGDLETLPHFNSGKFTAWFYFGDQRPMAFLRGIDSNWKVGATGIFQLEDKGNGWYYGEVAASELVHVVSQTDANISEIVRLAVEIPGGYTVYVDNLQWQPITVTEQTEKETDLLAVSTVVTGASNITAENSTDMVSGLNSLYSKKFTAAAGVAEKKSIRYELPKSYDMTNQALTVDIHRYDVGKYGIMMVSLQDSNGNTVVDAVVDNIYWLNWNRVEVDLHKYLEEGKSLADVKYVTFTFYFDQDTEYDRVYYLDNMTITPYETYDSVLNGKSALYIGDSISIARPFKGWAGLLEEHYGVDRTNVSVGGTTFSTIGTQIKRQLTNVPEDAQFDYIILDGGINDLYLSCPDLGKVSDLPVTTAPSKFDETTAIGAFEQLISMLKRRFPTAKIGYVITYQRADRWVNAFIPEVKKACEKWGVSCLSLPETDSFMQLFNDNTGAHTTDTVHANVAGYDLIMEYLPQWMEAIPAPEIIENFEPDMGKQEFDGGEFAAGVNQTLLLDNQNEVSKMSFDYKITSGESFHIGLMPDWSNYFGYFKFDANGASNSYPGITTEKLADGTVRVYVDFSKVTTVSGNPSTVLTMVFIRGDWTTANGSISNIRINDAAEASPRGEAIVAGVNQTINPDNLGELKSVSFDYKVANGAYFNIALMPDWSNFFGYYAFTADGARENYAGVTTKKLADGYIRATFDMAALTKINGTPTTAVDFLFIRGDWSDVNGYIDNVKFTAATAEPDVPESDIAAAATTLYVEQGEEFVILNLSDLQLHDGQDPQYTYDVIRQLVEKTNPDLITVLGDTAQDNRNYPATTNFANLVRYIDSFDIPWAPVFGNHDHDTYQPGYVSPKGVSDEWIMEQFANAKNCIFMEGPENVDGCGNYIVHIKEQGTGKLIRALYFFNSLLVGVNETHAQFYRDAVAYTTELNNGETLESIVFLHIPLPEYATVYSQQLAVDFVDTVGTVGRPATDLASGTADLFAAIKELGSTLNVIAGHDHENAYYMTYEGIKLIYNMKSSDGDDYHNVANTGGGVFTIGETTEFHYQKASVEQEITEATAYCLPLLGNWRNSGKALSFTFSATNTVATGNTISFVLCGSNPRRTNLELNVRNGGWNRLTEAVTVDLVNLTASIGSIVANNDGTYTYYLNLTDVKLNTAASEAAYGDETLKLIYFNSLNHSMKISDLCYVDGASVPQPPRGEGVDTTAGKTILLNNKQTLATISFEYKMVDGTKFNIALMPDWSNYFGYFAFGPDGARENYAGITTEVLEDGYVRVTFDLNAITKLSGNPSKVIDFLYIRSYDWSDAFCYIDNVQYEVYTEVDTPSYDIVAGSTITLEDATNISTLSFDYKIDSGERFNIALLNDWSNMYGYYKFTASGAAEQYGGVTCTVLSNGYIRVTFDMAALTKTTGSPSNTVKILYLHGSWTDATGTITNIQYS